MTNNQMLPLVAVMASILFSGCITSPRNRASTCPNRVNYELPAVPSSDSVLPYEAKPAQENGGFELPPPPSEASTRTSKGTALPVSAIQKHSTTDFVTIAPKTSMLQSNQSAPARATNLFD